MLSAFICANVAKKHKWKQKCNFCLKLVRNFIQFPHIENVTFRHAFQEFRISKVPVQHMQTSNFSSTLVRPTCQFYFARNRIKSFVKKKDLFPIKSIFCTLLFSAEKKGQLCMYLHTSSLLKISLNKNILKILLKSRPREF